jgi:D-sedoheptulose 7-phosphate isomerase
VQALARPGDVLIGISTSGNSRNVLRALEYARGHEVAAVAMTGGSGGSIAGIAQWEIRVPSSVTMHIQEAHITIGHILCDLVQRVLGTPQ